jgi:flagellar protein FlaF
MSSLPLDAYQSVEKATLNGRELEASVLSKAANLMQELSRDWDAPAREERMEEALRFNQRVWSFFQVELSQEENPLPAEIKRNLLVLSAFIDKRIFEVMAFPAREKLDILININRNISAGLRGDPG